MCRRCIQVETAKGRNSKRNSGIPQYPVDQDLPRQTDSQRDCGFPFGREHGQGEQSQSQTAWEGRWGDSKKVVREDSREDIREDVRENVREDIREDSREQTQRQPVQYHTV